MTARPTPDMASVSGLEVPCADFVAWVGEQDPAAAYDYWDFFSCPVTRFGRERGLLTEDQHYAQSDETFGLHARVGFHAFNEPRTFGALHERLSAALARSSVELGGGK